MSILRIVDRQVPLETETLHPGWLEVHPKDIINSVVQCIDATVENLEQLDINPSDVVTIGLASQRATAFAWDKLTGYSIYSGGILAADLRTQEMVQELVSNTVSLFALPYRFLKAYQ